MIALSMTYGVCEAARENAAQHTLHVVVGGVGNGAGEARVPFGLYRKKRLRFFCIVVVKRQARLALSESALGIIQNGVVLIVWAANACK